MLQFIFQQTVSVVKKDNDQILVAINNILVFEDATRKTKVYIDFSHNVIRTNIFYIEMHENEQKTLNTLKFLETFAHTNSERKKRDLWAWLTSPDLSSFTTTMKTCNLLIQTSVSMK